MWSSIWVMNTVDRILFPSARGERHEGLGKTKKLLNTMPRFSSVYVSTSVESQRKNRKLPFPYKGLPIQSKGYQFNNHFNWTNSMSRLWLISIKSIYPPAQINPPPTAQIWTAGSCTLYSTHESFNYVRHSINPIHTWTYGLLLVVGKW